MRLPIPPSGLLGSLLHYVIYVSPDPRARFCNEVRHGGPPTTPKLIALPLSFEETDMHYLLDLQKMKPLAESAGAA